MLHVPVNGMNWRGLGELGDMHSVAQWPLLTLCFILSISHLELIMLVLMYYLLVRWAGLWGGGDQLA